MDCGSTGDGQLDVCVQPAERRKQECQIDFVSIVRTDTCTVGCSKNDAQAIVEAAKDYNEIRGWFVK